MFVNASLSKLLLVTEPEKKAIYILPKSSGIGFYLDNTAQLYFTTSATFEISIAYITYLYAKKIVKLN